MTQERTPEPSGTPATPEPSGRREAIEAGESYEGLVNAEDVGSASRSCLAIIIALAVIGLLVCVFLAGALLME